MTTYYDIFIIIWTDDILRSQYVNLSETQKSEVYAATRIESIAKIKQFYNLNKRIEKIKTII